MPAKPFQTYRLIFYYGYSHAHDHVYISNLVHNSLDVRHIVFFYNYKYRERDDVGACCNSCLGVSCNTLTVEQIACIFGMKRADCDTDTKVGILHFYSYQIHSLRLANRKSKMAAVFPRWPRTNKC